MLTIQSYKRYFASQVRKNLPLVWQVAHDVCGDRQRKLPVGGDGEGPSDESGDVEIQYTAHSNRAGCSQKKDSFDFCDDLNHTLARARKTH